MANFRIITSNYSDNAVLGVSPAAVGTLPVTNLQDQTRARLWRSANISDQTITGDFNSICNVSAFALIRPNLTDAATLRLRIWDAPGQTGSLLYDSTTVTFSAIGWASAFATLFFNAVIGAKSFSIVISDPSNPSGYMQASRLFLGLHFEPITNISYGLRLAWEEASKQLRTDGGTLRTDSFQAYRRWSFRLGFLNETERTQLLEAMRVIGLRRDTFISCFPGVGGDKERDYAGQVKIVQIPDFTNDRFANYSTELVFEES
jgi:hypothetical protein